MCHHVFMYNDRDKNNNSETNGSIKYVSKDALQNEIYCN